MIDVIPELIGLFRKYNIQLINESVSDSENTYPMITYRERDNSDLAIGDNVGYSRISFVINIWAHTPKEASALAVKADMIMKSVNFSRDNFTEQNIGGLYRKIATYSRSIKENFKEDLLWQ